MHDDVSRARVLPARLLPDRDPRLLPLEPGALPCVRCGYCCRVAPCPFGRWDEQHGACAELTGEGDCAAFAHIVALPVAAWWAAPAFGAGCCSPLNPARAGRR